MNAALPKQSPQALCRWVGGSTRLLPELLALLPEGAAQLRYVDPFLGGGSPMLALGSKRALCGDLCSPLIAAWRMVRDNPHALAEQLRCIERERDEQGFADWYFAARDELNLLMAERPDRPVRGRLAGLFLAINASCYNGLWRVNSSGRFNVSPDPSKASASFYSLERLFALSTRLPCPLRLHCVSWERIVAEAKHGDLLFADPPYDVERTEGAQSGLFGPAPVRGHRYSAQGWSQGDLVRLVEDLAAARDRGAFVVSTNHATAFAVGLFERQSFEVHQVEVARSVSCSKRAAARELIAVGRPS